MFYKTFHSEIFQGNLNKQNYFEGWYYKLVSENNEVYALIPGISLHKDDKHAFIQVIDKEGNTKYIRYLLEEFEFDRKKLYIKIRDNIFTIDSIDLNIEELNLKGSVKFDNLTPLRKNFYTPSIMGPFAYLNFLECYHEVISLDHTLKGHLNINNSKIDFDGGRGYIEKDWGRSFPKGWVWIQSNTFKKTQASFMFSCARVPLFSYSFQGFLSTFHYNGKTILFATYTGAKVKDMEYREDYIKFSIINREYRLEVEGRTKNNGLLVAPMNGNMNRPIHESLNGEIHIKLFDKKAKLIFEDVGINSGCELVNIDLLAKK